MQDSVTKFVFECMLRSTLIAVGAGALLLLLRVREARFRHAIWASVTVWMLAVPITLWLVPVHAVEVPVDLNFSLNAIPPIEVTPLPPVPAQKPAPPQLDPVREAILGIYLLGAAALFARLVIGTVRSCRLRASATMQRGHLTSDACTVPVTVGFWRPAVILPSGWTSWPASQIDAVFAHENEHALRRDPLVQWLALFNRAVFWFHPLAWWLDRKIAALAEEACDAAVLQQGHERLEYTNCLMKMARLVQQTGGRVNVAGMSMAGSFLAKRIRRIVEGSPAPKLTFARRASVTVVCTVMAAGFSAGAIGISQVRRLTLPKIAPPMVGSQATQPPESPSKGRPKLLAPTKQMGPGEQELDRKRTEAIQRVVDRRSQREEQAMAEAQLAAVPATPATGNLAGTVEDATGARIPNCDIAVRSAGGDTVATATSGAAGAFRLPNLAPGTYSVEFSARGFARRTVVATITSGGNARIDALLEVGQIFETVEVTAAKSAAATASPDKQTAAASYPIQVGGHVRVSRLVQQSRPIYPADARDQGVEGTVILRAVISREGVPENVHVLNEGEVDSRLAQSALEAVRQWRYEPSTLDATPVNVQNTIEIVFRLSQ
ncbi:MAG TPA: M56 family metallopeptidase [Bryobacteraceae bacterium]|nr:M56 family metallopeptidase [Bryobacteraceae bacterium]